MSRATHARTARLATFAWTWALVVVLHLLYLDGSYAAFGSFTVAHGLYVALGAAAVALLVVPRCVPLLAIVCVLTPITAWEEAPVLGNHWLLASLVALALLLAMAIGSLRRPLDLGDALDRDGLPTARLVFLVAYGFAALSKFNSSFADPTVSCANLFLDQVTRSIGIDGVHASSGAGWTHLVPIVVMAIEASVVVLLALAPTRVLGVLLALVFHGIISLDTEHSFSDFTGLVVALALLFLPDEWFAELHIRFATAPLRTIGRIARLAIAAVVATLLVWQSTDTGFRSRSTIGDWRDVVWWSVGAAILGLVITGAVRSRSLRSDVALLPADRWLVAVPGIAVLVGLGPWLGVRTGTSWNMYANLVTSQGRTNSWLVPGTLRLLDEPDDLVRITASDDPALGPYVRSGASVPFVNLRLYTSTHPDTSITFERAGRTTTVEHTRADPALGRAPEWWWRKVLTYRSVDLEGPAACQDTMGALR